MLLQLCWLKAHSNANWYHTLTDLLKAHRNVKSLSLSQATGNVFDLLEARLSKEPPWRSTKTKGADTEGEDGMGMRMRRVILPASQAVGPLDDILQQPRGACGSAGI